MSSLLAILEVKSETSKVSENGRIASAYYEVGNILVYSCERSSKATENKKRVDSVLLGALVFRPFDVPRYLQELRER